MTAAKLPELKPCPLCGEMPGVFHYKNELRTVINCAGNHHTVSAYDTTELLAYAAWNRRKGDGK